jgi:hypothetical protein
MPPELAPPGAQYWRSVGLPPHTGWFLLNVRDRQRRLFNEAVALAVDHDVVDVLRAFGGSFESLTCVAPTCIDGMRGWKALQVHEVWWGGDGRSNELVVVFLTQDGRALSGDFLDEVEAPHLRELVAKRSLVKE